MHWFYPSQVKARIRLNAVGQLSMVNDCSHPKLSLNGVFLAGPPYTSKLSLQAYSSRVTAFARVEVALPTLSSQSPRRHEWPGCRGSGSMHGSI